MGCKMQRRRMPRISLWLCLAGGAALCAASAPARASLAKLTGGSGNSGTLSSNAAVRKQQLIADPPDPTMGSQSVSYDPAVVTLLDFRYGPGYAQTSGQPIAFVELRNTGGVK